MSVTRPSPESLWRLSKHGGHDEQRTHWHLLSGVLASVFSGCSSTCFPLVRLFPARAPLSRSSTCFWLGSSSAGSPSLSSLHGASIIVLGAPGGARGVFGATGGASRATGSSSCVDVGSPPSTSAPSSIDIGSPICGGAARSRSCRRTRSRFLTPLDDFRWFFSCR